MKNVATVYSTTTCPYCTMMKNYLTEENIEFTEVLLTDQAGMDELIAKTGEMGVPQTELNGKWILGFDTEAVQAALEA